MLELVSARVFAIGCGYKDGNDLDRLRRDPLLKLAVGRCPESGAALASQPTISRLENAPSRTQAARLTGALVDQFCTTVTPGAQEVLDIDDTFCAARQGGAMLDPGCGLPLRRAAPARPTGRLPASDAARRCRPAAPE